MDTATQIAPSDGAVAEAAASGRGRLRAGVVGLLVVAAVVGLAWVTQQPPAPVPASAPASQFSAERALVHLRRIAAEGPTPIGSAGSTAVRDYLVAELSAVGFAVEVHEGLGARTFGDSTVAGRVDNVVATLPGRDTTGRVVLAAHYDTTFGSPGAADDKAAVAAILEAARAVAGGERLRNDVVVLLTDGEEPGLLGAEAFAAQHRYGAGGGVVLNWEATGNAGASVLFETSQGNADLITEFAASAPHPVGDSALAAMYQAGSQNTDFTVLSETGFAGLNFGLSDGTASYHHGRDTIANLDAASLQHHGANMLGLTRGFGERDLAAVRAQRDATFFTAFGQVIAYPDRLIRPLAALASAAVIALAIVARRRRLTTLPRLLAGTAASLIPLVAAPAAAIGFWEALVGIRPGYAAMFMGDPYRPVLYRMALGALTVSLLLAWYVALRRRVGAIALAAGALVWPAVLGIAGAWLVPAMSYYGALPAAAAAAGMLGALLMDERPAWRAVALTAGALPGAVLLVLGGETLLGILGIAGGAVGVFFFALAGLLMLPLVELALPVAAGSVARRRGAPLPVGRRGALLPVAAAGLAMALTAAGLAVDRFDGDHPQQSHLLYLLDAGGGSAMWASRDSDPHGWVAQHAPDADGRTALPLPYGTTARWTGPAEPLPLDAPHLRVRDVRSDGGGIVVDLHVASRRDAGVLTLHTDRRVEDVTITAGGRPPVTATPAHPDGGDRREWPYELRFYDPPPDGVGVRLRMRGQQPPRIVLSDYTVGLEQVPGLTPRPGDLDRSLDHSSDLVVVGRAHDLTVDSAGGPPEA
jgi:hypothetical protein